MNKQTCILVLGMHRSGTSALTGVLELLGVYLADTTKGDKNNEKGYFENWKVQQINDEIFANVNSSWHDELFSQDKIERTNESTENLKNIILDDFRYSNLFSIKDPRVCLLFPYWEKAINELGIKLKVILAYRNPIEVANSLHKRDGMSVEKGMLLWAYHFLLAEKFSRGYERVFVGFDDLMSDAPKVINEISSKLSLDLADKYARHQNEISDFLEPGLKHHNISIENLSVNVPNIIKDILSLRSGFNNENLSEKFDALRGELFTYQRLFYHDDIVTSLKEAESVKYTFQEKSRELNQANKTLQEKENEFNQANKILQEKDNELNQANKTLQEKENEFKQANKILQEKDSELNQTAQKLRLQESELHQARQALQEKAKVINSLKAELTNVYMSNSWKVTRVLRKFKRLLRK